MDPGAARRMAFGLAPNSGQTGDRGRRQRRCRDPGARHSRIRGHDPLQEQPASRREARMTSTLAVWMSDRRVGTLEKTPAGDLLYSPDIDVTLTVAAAGLGTWSPQLTRNWFDGLLPEGDRRARLAARFGLRAEDTFGLLAEIGWECAGAVAVLPEGRSPSSGRS